MQQKNGCITKKIQLFCLNASKKSKQQVVKKINSQRYAPVIFSKIFKMPATFMIFAESNRTDPPIGFPSRKTGPEQCNAAPDRIFFETDQSRSITAHSTL